MNFRLFFYLFSFFLLGNSAFAQDPQFSQFYAAPLYLNPAFTGSALEGRWGLNYRNQWPQISEANFETFSGYFDTYFDEANSGVGLLLTHDREGFAGLRSTSISLGYAYQLKLTEKLTFRAGGAVGWTSRDANFADLTFGNQFDPTTGTFDPNLPSEPALIGASAINFIDIALGGLIYTKRWWFGFSGFHLTEPQQSFFDDNTSILPARFSAHGGYKFYLNSEPFENQLNRKREISITPTLQYKFQGDFDQLDAGVYFVYQPIIFGLWYRGLPFKTFSDENDETFPNNEALVFMVGLLDVKSLSLGYSFDYTLSQLGISSGGAHEISLSYHFPLTQKKLPPKDKRFIPCPKI